MNNKVAIYKNLNLAALLLILGIVFVTHQDRNCDFYSYYSALSWGAESGQPPYLEWTGNPMAAPGSAFALYCSRHWNCMPLEFLYPPTAIIQLRPFTWIPSIEAAAVFWRLFNLLIFIAIVLVARDLSSPRRHPLILLLLLGAYGPLRQGLWLGQVSLWVGFLLLVYFWGLYRGRGGWAGLALGLAISLKVFPIFWAPVMLLYPRAARRCLASLLATLALSIGLSLIPYGWSGWTQYYSLVLAKLSLYPPKGTISLYSWIDSWPAATGGMGAFLRQYLFALIYLPALFVLFWLRPRSAARKRRALLMLTAVIHLAMPLTWEHYLTIFGILLCIELSGLVGRRARRLPCTTSLMGLIFLLSGCSWIPGLARISSAGSFAQIGLIAGALIPMSIWLDIILYRRRQNVSGCERSILA